jgi:branched-chain amino acid transport system substrate-binding protein
VSRARTWVRTATTAVVAMVAALATGCVATGQAPERVLIGVDLELTGPGSHLGQVYKRALELRVDQINEAGLLGNRRLELTVLDNRTDAAVAATNISRLAGTPNISAIITGFCDACVTASLDSINNAAIPVVSLGTIVDLVQPIDERRYVFKVSPDSFHVAQVMVREMRRLDVESVGLITSDQPYGVEGQRELTAAAQRQDIDVESRVISEDAQGVDGVVADLLSGPDPDAVVIWATGPASVAVAVSLRNQGFTGQLFLAPAGAAELFVGSAGRAALDGALMVFTESLVIDGLIASSPAKAARQTWLRDYASQVGTYHAQAALAADALQVIVAAINASNSTDREKLRAALENVQIDGFTGPIRFRLESHSGLSPQSLVLLVAQGDRWRLAAS